jgi:hypothetical protein
VKPRLLEERAGADVRHREIDLLAAVVDRNVEVVDVWDRTVAREGRVGASRDGCPFDNVVAVVRDLRGCSIGGIAATLLVRDGRCGVSIRQVVGRQRVKDRKCQKQKR